jgi:hypothetical protein
VSRETLTNFRAEDFASASSKSGVSTGLPKKDEETQKAALPNVTDEEKAAPAEAPKETAKKAPAKKAPVKKAADKK